MSQTDAERRRLDAARDGTEPWYRWGPYLAERQWGTVREDYSAGGDAWGDLPHDHARSRAYRWGEDGLLGISDDMARLCFALALWNGRDHILKERLFGLTGPQGNHGEDVKEAYWYLDATPTASYLRALYRYPQRAFPYDELVLENALRTRSEPEHELIDTGAFDEHRFFDVQAEYAKAGPEDIVIRVTVTNHGPEDAALHLLPTLWFRNTWAWGREPRRPSIRPAAGAPQGVLGGYGAVSLLRADHHLLGTYWLAAAEAPALLFTENESNAERLWRTASRTAAVKDAFHGAVIEGDGSRLSADPSAGATKAAAHYAWVLAPGETRSVRLRLARGAEPASPDEGADEVIIARRLEADAFYAAATPTSLTPDQRLVQRQAFAGLIWSKQSYHFDVGQWLDGDPAGPAPPVARRSGRNAEWRELNAGDVISMPDAWEYPWFAAWDLAFHCLPFALVDPEFAKRQLLLLTREWYMHPNGQLPAYEWSFGDVNPPVHAWAAWRVYKIDRRISGRADRDFLERVFHKLLLNFTWWVNRKDLDGRNIFQGGFLGLDNIGVFDRSAPLPLGGHLGQADGTAWMGFYSLQMMAIALELARQNPVYEDVATKFFEHFLYIAGALNGVGDGGIPLWDDEDGFYYDVLHLPDDTRIKLRVRSLVGLIPLLAVETIEPEVLTEVPGFARRLRWFLRNRPDLAAFVASWEEPGMGQRRLMALVHGHRMKRLLRRMLDPEEFLSPFGVRSLSRAHQAQPYELDIDGMNHAVEYEPAESGTPLFGGNSNWRGPVWFPIDYLLIEALERFHHYYGDGFRVESPVGSGANITLRQVADDLAGRMTRLFMLDSRGRRPVHGDDPRVADDPAWRDHILFHEYFHADTGAGLGAGHQTGWTALVATLLDGIGRAQEPAGRGAQDVEGAG